MRKGNYLKSAVITFVFLLASSAAVPVHAKDYIAGDGALAFCDFEPSDSSTPTTVGNATIGENASTGGSHSTAIGSSANGAAIRPDQGIPFLTDNSTAVGYVAQAVCVTVGSYAVSSIAGTAIGNNSYADGGVAIGTAAMSGRPGDSPSGNIIIGAGASTYASGVTMIGRNASAIGDTPFSTVMGDGASVAQSNSSAYGSGATTIGNKSTAIGSNTSATATYSVALGYGSVADRANTVSVGSAGNERQITNVADGTESTDVLNVRQLNQFGERIDTVGAMAAAISGLRPMPHDPNAPLQLLAGGGTYSGRWAAAVGVGFYAHEKFLLKIGMAFSGSEKMGQLGLEWKWGRAGKKAMAAHNTVTALQATARQLQAQLKQQQAQTQKQQDQQQNQIKQLQDQIKQLLNTQESPS